MAKAGVVVRRLDAIENLGSMDMLCTDKTGTLTEGVIHLDGCLDVEGKKSPQIAVWARLNATLQTGLKNPLDEAIANVEDAMYCLARYAKVDEIPYDFIRKRLSVLVRELGTNGIWSSAKVPSQMFWRFAHPFWSQKVPNRSIAVVAQTSRRDSRHGAVKAIACSALQSVGSLRSGLSHGRMRQTCALPAFCFSLIRRSMAWPKRLPRWPKKASA
jgi:magnesium-transporting ATPase (P-type)